MFRSFKGTVLTVRLLARLHDEKVPVSRRLFGADAVQSTQVDFFLELVAQRSLSAPEGLKTVLEQLNKHLAPRTYLVGSALTIADLVVFDALHSNSSWRTAGEYNHVERWFSFVRSSAAVSKYVAAEEKAAAKPSGGSFEIGLVGATMGNVVTRFPPEPSGYLHIGHIKAAMLNDHFAREYKGRLILRFDDTNPSKEKDEYVVNILKDLKTMNIKHDILTHTSDHFALIQEKAEEMIRNGHAYIDATPVEEMRKMRGDGIESSFRSNSVETNLEMWEQMKQGSTLGKTYAMRAKIDMKCTNKTMRDPVMYRCNDTPHHRTGSTYKLYPTYDFACPIVDSIEGVTHTLRTSEYNQRDEQYMWILTALNMRKPHIWAYSRLNFVQTLMSKRNLAWFVDEGRVEGWNDPRFPTVQGILRRGMQVSALREFILLQGASRNANMMSWDKVWNINKKHIEPIAPRYTAISEDRVTVNILNFTSNTCTTTSVPLHGKNSALGSIPFVMTPQIIIERSDAKALAMSEEFTLMAWGNAIVRCIASEGDRVTSIDVELHLAGNVQDTKAKLTWLPVSDAPEHAPVNLKFVDFDYLITAQKLLDGQDFKDFITPNSREDTIGIGQAAMGSLKVDDIIQIQRRGYFRVDSVAPLVLFNIPTGKTKGMSVVADSKP